MRNLKKVMALALATVMLFGMMVMGAGAADKADEVKAEYATATAVLKAIGVFEGDENGMRPNDTLTRAEAAVSVAKLALTKETANKIKASATSFADVTAGYDWAAGAIAWAESKSIVSGIGEGNYDPAGTLKGYQYAKMLLVVLGYNAAIEGYTGANWDVNVHLDALMAGLLKGLDTIDLSAAITRAEATQMAFNALLADCVVYDKLTNERSEATAKEAHAYKTTGNDDVKQLVEELYPTLKLTVADPDEYGYAQQTWKFGAVKVVTEKNYDVLWTKAGKIGALKGSDIYAEAGVAAKEDVKIYANGSDLGKVIDLTDDKKADNKGATVGTAYNGAALEYVKNGSAYQLMIKYAYPAYVTSVDATKGEATLTVYLEGKTATVVENIDEYVAKDWYLVNVTEEDGKYDIFAAEKVEPVAGKVTGLGGTSAAPTGVYIDGVCYDLAGAKVGTYIDTALFAPNKSVKAILQNGYVVALVPGDAEPAAAPTLDNVYYVAKISGNLESYNGFTKVEFKNALLVSLKDNSVITAMVKKDVNISGLVTMADEKVNGVATGYKTLTAYTGKDKVYGVTTFTGNIAATDKSLVVGGEKAYFKNSVIVEVTTSDLGVVTLKTYTLPGAYNIKGTADVVVNLNDTAANDIAFMIVDKGEIELPAAPPATDLYYIVAGDTGVEYVGTKTYYTVKVFDMKTGNSFTAKVEAASKLTGFVTGKETTTAGVWSFTEKANNAGGIFVPAGTKGEFYGDLITLEGTAVQDYTKASALFVNAAGSTKATALDKLFDKDGATQADIVVFPSAITAAKVDCIVVVK